MAEGIATIQGRDIRVRPLTDAQQILMTRDANILRKGDADSVVVMAKIARILDILESAVEDPLDIEFLEQLILERKVELKELVALVRKAHQDEAPPPVKARRGRPPKRPTT